VVTTDTAKYVTSKTIRDSCGILGIGFRPTSVTHQQSNYVERKIQEYNKVIASYCFDHSKDWLNYIYLAQKVLNDTVNKNSGMTPTEIMFSFKPETVLDRLLTLPDDATLRKDRIKIEAQVNDLLSRLQTNRAKSKKYYDKKHTNLELAVGDLVALDDPPAASTDHNVRYMCKYSSPWEIETKLSSNNYIIKWAGKPVTDKRDKRSRTFLVHVRRLKPITKDFTHLD
jgi:hypothetical protein